MKLEKGISVLKMERISDTYILCCALVHKHCETHHKINVYLIDSTSNQRAGLLLSHTKSRNKYKREYIIYIFILRVRDNMIREGNIGIEAHI